jgi:nucleoid DNA-binding protein
MTKLELAKEISDLLEPPDLSCKDVARVLDAFDGFMQSTLLSGEIFRFGVLTLKPYRVGPVMRCNPKTGEPVSVPAHTKVKAHIHKAFQMEIKDKNFGGEKKQ